MQVRAACRVPARTGISSGMSCSQLLIASTLLVLSCSFAAQQTSAASAASSPPLITQVAPKRIPGHARFFLRRGSATLAYLTALASEASVADVETTQSCLRLPGCREANPLVPHSRASAYAVSFGVVAGFAVISARLHRKRRGNLWVAPLVELTGAHAVAAILNVRTLSQIEAPRH